MIALSPYERLTDLLVVGEYDNIYLSQNHSSSKRPIATGNLGKDYIISINESAYSTDTDKYLALNHEISHIEVGGFYDENTPKHEIDRIEYRVDKATVEALVKFENYSRALLSGCFTVEEQSDFWDVPERYVSKVHEIYERSRWDDVQKLKAQVAAKWDC